MKKYYTNGTLDDEKGVGVTLEVRTDNGFSKTVFLRGGEESLGFKNKEITEDEYNVWKERIKNPDNKVYFSGIFRGVGVVNKATHESLMKKQSKILFEQRSIDRIDFLKNLHELGFTKEDVKENISGISLIEFEEKSSFKFKDSVVKEIISKLSLKFKDVVVLLGLSDIASSKWFKDHKESILK